MVAERQLQFHSQPASSAQYVTTECADVPDVSIEERNDGLSSRSVTRSTVAVQAGVQLGQDDPESEMQVEQNSLSSSRVSDQ